MNFLLPVVDLPEKSNALKKEKSLIIFKLHNLKKTKEKKYFSNKLISMILHCSESGSVSDLVPRYGSIYFDRIPFLLIHKIVFLKMFDPETNKKHYLNSYTGNKKKFTVHLYCSRFQKINALIFLPGSKLRNTNPDHSDPTPLDPGHSPPSGTSYLDLMHFH